MGGYGGVAFSVESVTSHQDQKTLGLYTFMESRILERITRFCTCVHRLLFKNGCFPNK